MEGIFVQIRSVGYSQSEDLRIFALYSFTILQLKKKIQLLHPKKPTTTEQRLIFNGKFLQDGDLLKDVLKSYDLSVPPIFQLITLRNPSFFSKGKEKQSSSSSEQHPPTIPQPPTPTTTSDSTKIVPLGNPFQYVLVNGAPYLMEFSNPHSFNLNFSAPGQTSSHHFDRRNHNRDHQTSSTPRQTSSTQSNQSTGRRRRVLLARITINTNLMVLILKLGLFVYFFSNGDLLQTLLLCFFAFLMYMFRTRQIRLPQAQNRQGGTPAQNSSENQPSPNTPPTQLTPLERLKVLISCFFQSIVPNALD